MKRMLLLLFLTLPLTVNAEIYTWTDAAGTVHFTEDLGSVPKKYRAKAARQAASGDASPAAVPSGGSAKQEKAASPKQGVSAATGAPVAVPADGAPANGKTLFGERTGAAWQQEFRAVRAELQKVETELEAAKKEANDTGKLYSRQQISEINARNKQLFERYEALRLRYNSLVEQANKAGLPREFAE